MGPLQCSRLENPRDRGAWWAAGYVDEVAAKVKKAGKWLGTAAGDFPRWKARGVDWFAGTSDWGAMAVGIRAFKSECDKFMGKEI